MPKPKFSLTAKVEQISNIEKATRATEQLPFVPAEPTRKRPGKKKRSIPHANGMTLFLDTETRRRLNNFSSLYEGIDKADYIRVALREFFDRHTTDTGTLDAEAIHEITEYVHNTTE